MADYKDKLEEWREAARRKARERDAADERLDGRAVPRLRLGAREPEAGHRRLALARRGRARGRGAARPRRGLPRLAPALAHALGAARLGPAEGGREVRRLPARARA